MKKKGVRLTSKEVKNTVMFREGFTNDMGCKGWNGVGILSEVDGLMGAEQYVAILKGYLQQSMEKSGIPTDNVCIEEDNNPKHTFRSAQNNFRSKGSSF